MEASLMAADAALESLLEAAAFAEAQHGSLHRVTLQQYHGELLPLLTLAFDELLRSNDLSLSRRDRIALRAHAADIGTHIVRDVEALRENHARVLARVTVNGLGAKAVVDAAVSRGVVQLGAWWDGRLRLGPLTAPAIAKKRWETYRPMPRWIPWAAGAGAVTATAGPVLLILL